MSSWPNVRQLGRNFRPNISADLAENFGRIFGFGRTLTLTKEPFIHDPKPVPDCDYY